VTLIRSTDVYCPLDSDVLTSRIPVATWLPIRRR